MYIKEKHWSPVVGNTKCTKIRGKSHINLSSYTLLKSFFLKDGGTTHMSVNILKYSKWCTWLRFMWLLPLILVHLVLPTTGDECFSFIYIIWFFFIKMLNTLKMTQQLTKSVWHVLSNSFFFCESVKMRLGCTLTHPTTQSVFLVITEHRVKIFYNMTLIWHQKSYIFFIY